MSSTEGQLPWRLTTHYQVRKHDIPRRLLDALPPILVVPHDEMRGPAMDLLATEVDRDKPGQQIVLDRLLALALIATLRAWFARPEASGPGWYRAQGDRVNRPPGRLRQCGRAQRRLQARTRHQPQCAPGAAGWGFV